jgi:outer membrane protein
MKKSMLLLGFIAFFSIVNAQTTSTSLSLEQAVSYALQNNTTLQNKKLDIDYARGQVLETASIGLPQINGKIDFNNNIQLPVFVFPNPATGRNEPIRVGQNFSTTAGISVSQLLFDGTYFLGLKAANQFVEMASQMENMSVAQVKNTVVKSYYLALIAAENLKLIKANYQVINKTYEQTLAMYKTGFAEKLDADRLFIAKSNLETQIKSIENQVEISLKMLKLNIGMDINAPLTLSDNLENLYTANEDLSIGDGDIYKVRPEYKVLNKQQELNQLNLKRYKVSLIPSISAFYNYQTATYSDELKFNPWFNTSLWGMSLKVPIFKGLNTKAQLDKVGVEILKTENEITNFKQAAGLEVFQAKSKYTINLESLALQKQNMNLAQEILTITSKKYENGLGSNLEVLTAQQDLKTSQTNYLNAIYDVLVAKADLLKALGKN